MTPIFFLRNYNLNSWKTKFLIDVSNDCTVIWTVNNISKNL